MKKYLFALLIALQANPAWAAATVTKQLKVQEADGSPAVNDVTVIKVSNGSLTDNGSGSVSITTGGGGGAGDIESVVAGAGLTGGATSGDATVDVGEGAYIDVAADAISVDPTEFKGGITWGDGSTASEAWTMNLSGTDPVLNWISGGFSFTGTGTFSGLLTGNVGAAVLNGSSTAGFLDFYEDSDNGSNRVRVIGPASTGDVTVTLPAATDTLVGKDTTDTLTNKTMTSAANNIGADTADALTNNGSNCSAGSFPLGVDASGAAESCTSAAIASYRELYLQPAGAVLDDGAPPDLSVVESTGTGTPRRLVADFDPSTDQIVYWTFEVPSDMASGNWLLNIDWFTNDTGANEDAIWYAQMSCTSEGDADTMGEDAAGSANTASENCNATEANRLITTTLTLSNLDSVAAGDTCTIIFGRDADDSIGDADNDGLSSDARLVGVHLKIPRA